MAATGCCLICFDDDISKEQLYCCQTVDCDYKLCIPCIKRSFEDASGQNYERCPECRVPMAQDVLEYFVGPRGVRSIQDELRNKVEFDVQEQVKLRESRQEDMKDYESHAGRLYNDLAQQLNMKCPRCKTVFDDYDGCNALTCSNSSCKAAICAICLRDCGSDAHQHVRQVHSGNSLFDKKAFEDARKKREDTTSQRFLRKLAEEDGEPFEVIQLVKNMCEGPTGSGVRGRDGPLSAAAFLDECREQLQTAVKSDRLGVLREATSTTFQRRGLVLDDVSPRSAIPEEYKLELHPKEGSIYKVRLFKKAGFDILDGRERWDSEPLPSLEKDKDKESKQSSRQVDSLVNVVSSLKCAVLAMEGQRCLWQTVVAGKPKERELGNDEVCILFVPVNEDGSAHIQDAGRQLEGGRIFGINPNRRFLQMEKHVEQNDEATMLFGALRSYVGVAGAEKPSLLFPSIEVPAPASFEALNEQQRGVAHPLALKTAKEVAGPPGTGKSKTITELIRCLLDCTTAKAVVLSERNGAIDAIAEKFVDRCLDLKKDGCHVIKDIQMWNNIVVFGSKGAMGASAKLFLMQSKLDYHPQLVALRKEVAEIKRKEEGAAKKMWKSIAKSLLSCEHKHLSYNDLHRRARVVESGTEADFDSASNICYSLASFLDDAAEVLDERPKSVTKGALIELVTTHSALLQGLVRVSEDAMD